MRNDPAVVSWGQDRVDTFHRGIDNALWHNWSINGRWSGWENLGGVLISTPAVVSWGPNRIDIFHRGTDSALWQKSWLGDRWSEWVSHGGIWTSEP